MGDKAILVTASYDHTIRFWDAFKEESTKYLEYGNDIIVNRLEVSLDKMYLGAACSSSIRIYDPQGKTDGPLISYDGWSGNVTGIGFQKDNKWIYSCSEDGSIKIHDLRSSSFVRNYPNKESINTIVLHPNEGELITGDQLGNIRIYDIAIDKCRAKLAAAPDIGIRSLSMAANTFCLVASDSAGFCHVWSLKNGEELIPFQSKFQAHEDYILKCALSPDVKYLATCSADKTVKIWELNEDKGFSLYKILYGHSKWVWDCAFSCDSKLLLTGSSDGNAKIWIIETGEVVRNFSGHTKAINCLALNDKYT